MGLEIDRLEQAEDLAEAFNISKCKTCGFVSHGVCKRCNK